MNLKESYRYANYLDGLLSTAYSYLRNRGFITTTKQNHLRSKANNEAVDEVIEVQKPFDVEFTPNEVIDFVVRVLDEKAKLFSAIALAKSKAEINIDNAIAMNKKKQEFVSILNNMADIKASETTTIGKAYKFDVTVDYNRTDVRNLVKKYLQETDAVSAKLDVIEITTEVDFTPSWDVNTKFDEVVLA